MKFINLLTIAGSFLFASSSVLAWGNYGLSCANVKLTGNNILSATCKKADGSTGDSSLNLNTCFANRNGNLKCEPR